MDLGYWLWLSSLNGLRQETALKFVEAFGSVKQLYYADKRDLEQAGITAATAKELNLLSNKNMKRAAEIEKRCEELGVRILCLMDAAYPERLRNIYNPPLVIYIKGNLPNVDETVCIGVVGTRKASSYGLETAERIGRELAEGGAAVITGIAEGIDTAAAKGALKAGGRVVAVLGTGPDIVYPAWNSRLQNTIAKVGAVVSEYPPGTRGSRMNFPMRNRIISGLSLGVAIVQAPEKSGALITAARAQEQGRDIFVVPGNVDDSSFFGSNALIRDGACLIRSGSDIIEEYKWRLPRKTGKIEASAAGPDDTSEKLYVDNKNSMEYIDLTEQLGSLSENELKTVGALTGGEYYSDELILKTGLPSNEVLAALTMLELKGYVKTLQDGRYKLLISAKH